MYLYLWIHFKRIVFQSLKQDVIEKAVSNNSISTDDNNAHERMRDIDPQMIDS